MSSLAEMQEDVPESEITDEPRIDSDTIVEEVPNCLDCGEPVSYDDNLLVADHRVVKVIRTPVNFDGKCDLHTVLNPDPEDDEA